MLKDKQQDRYADSILTDNRGLVRLSSLGVNATVLIQGRRVKASDIPLAVFTLNCGHVDKGIAVKVGDWHFCPTCQTLGNVIKSQD